MTRTAKKRSPILRILGAVFGTLIACCGLLYGLGQLALAYPGLVLWSLVGLWIVAPLGLAAAYLRLSKRLARQHAQLSVQKIHDPENKVHGWAVDWVMQDKEDDLEPER